MRVLRGVVYMKKSRGPRTDRALGDTAGGCLPGQGRPRPAADFLV